MWSLITIHCKRNFTKKYTLGDKWFPHPYFPLEKSGKFQVPDFPAFATDVYETSHTYTLYMITKLNGETFLWWNAKIGKVEHFQSGSCDKGINFYQ